MRNHSFSHQIAAEIKGRRGCREAEPAQSSSRFWREGVAATRAPYTRVLARGGKVLGWVAASLPLPAPSTVCLASWSSSRAQALGEGDEKSPGILTHHQPLSRARSKSQDFGPGHCRRGRGDSIWGIPALPRVSPQPLPVSEAGRKRGVEPQSALNY